MTSSTDKTPGQIENERWGRPRCNEGGFGATDRATVKPDSRPTVVSMPHETGWKPYPASAYVAA